MRLGTYERKLKSVPCVKCGTVIIATRNDAQCRACILARKVAWNSTHKEYFRDYARTKRDPAKERERSRLKRIKYADKDRERLRRYHADRPGLKTLWDANRRAAKKRATPDWANKFFISEAYHLAKLREKVCGGLWHVDHIVPLQSKYVCGLHVESNLQVIPGHLNQTKSNVTWPDMP